MRRELVFGNVPLVDTWVRYHSSYSVTSLRSSAVSCLCPCAAEVLFTNLGLSTMYGLYGRCTDSTDANALMHLCEWSLRFALRSHI